MSRLFLPHIHTYTYFFGCHKAVIPFDPMGRGHKNDITYKYKR